MAESILKGETGEATTRAMNDEAFGPLTNAIRQAIDRHNKDPEAQDPIAIELDEVQASLFKQGGFIVDQALSGTGLTATFDLAHIDLNGKQDNDQPAPMLFLHRTITD